MHAFNGIFRILSWRERRARSGARPAGLRRIAFFKLFHVAPSDQKRAIDLLRGITDAHVRRAPGFVSSTLHRSADGSKVAMYALWRDQASYEAMRRDPATSAVLAELMEIARFEPGQFEVVQTFAGQG